MSAPEYRCPISQTSLQALEALASVVWTSVAVVAPARPQPGHLILCTPEIRVGGDRPVSIAAIPVDIVPKLEVFRLDARFAVDDAKRDSRFKSRDYVDPEEMMSVFRGNCPSLLIAGRRHTVPGWATSLVGGLIVEDLLLVRHTSGQQAFVSVSDNQPATLVIARRREDVPNSDATIEYLRFL